MVQNDRACCFVRTTLNLTSTKGGEKADALLERKGVSK